MVSISAFFHCPPAFGFWGTEKEAIIIASRECFGGINPVELNKILEEYYETGEVPPWLTDWLDRQSLTIPEFLPPEP